MPVVDQSTDPAMAGLLSRIADRPKLAAAIMDVDVDPDDLAKLPDRAFAWPEKRAFPVHDAGHALMSCVYREGVEGVPEHVDHTLKEACEVYGVDRTLLAAPKVAAAPPSTDDYLLPEIRRLLVKDATQVKVAEQRLLNEGKRLSLEHRAQASARLVEKAASYNVHLRAETLKMAGFTVTDTRELADWLEARREAAPIEHKDAFQKLADAARRLPSELRDRREQIKLAEAIQELDSLSGLAQYHGKKLPDPMATVFNTTKVAGQGVTLAGRFVPIERLAQYDSDFYSDALGPDIVREASNAGGQIDPHKLAMVLGTLPLDMQRILSSQIR
jgi:hypothetical protein